MQQLLDARMRPIPVVLAGDPIAEQIRPNLSRSWADLQSAIDTRSIQLDSTSSSMNLLGEIADLTEAINNKAADVDRLVNVRSNENLDSTKKRLLVRCYCILFYSYFIRFIQYIYLICRKWRSMLMKSNQKWLISILK